MKRVLMLLMVALYADISAMETPERGFRNKESNNEESNNDLTAGLTSGDGDDSPPRQQDREGNTPLHRAAQANDLDAIRVSLVVNPNSINAQNNHGATPLHIAASEGNEEAVQLLLRAKTVNLNLVDKNGDSPLHEACLEGHHKIVRRLVSAGANVHLRNNNRETPWDYAEATADEFRDKVEEELYRWLDRLPE